MTNYSSERIIANTLIHIMWTLFIKKGHEAMTATTLYCSFCGVNEQEVSILIKSPIPGPCAAICEGCIAICNQMIQGCVDKMVKAGDPGTAGLTPPNV